MAAQFLSGDFCNAVDIYTKSINSNENVCASKLCIVYFNRAAAFYELELFRKCVKDCDSCLQLDSDCLEAYLLKGRAKSSMGDVKHAIQILQLAYEKGLDSTCSNVHTVQEIYKELELLRAKTFKIVKGDSMCTPLKSSKASADSSQAFKTNEKYSMRELEQAATIACSENKISYGSGDINTDEKIAIGYMLVNLGEFEKAIDHFNILEYNCPNLSSVLLGRGSAYATLNSYDKALIDFSSAIRVDPSCSDAYKRRGQTKAACAYLKEAIEDFNKAYELNTLDSDILNQRGCVLYRLKQYKKALLDFEIYISCNPSDKDGWNSIGLAETALGHCEAAFIAFTKCIDIDEKFLDARINYAQAKLEHGDTASAISILSRAIEIDPEYHSAYYLRGLCYYWCGMIDEACNDFQGTKKNNYNLLNSCYFIGLCFHAQGRYRNAMQEYDNILEQDENHQCFYQRECLIYYWNNATRPIIDISPDSHLPDHFKEAMCRRIDPSRLLKYRKQSIPANEVQEIPDNPIFNSIHMRNIVEKAKQYERFIQLDSPGFSSNLRQHRMFGLAVLEMIQFLQKFPKKESYDASYIQFMSIAIKWRQVSESNDPVWWINLLTNDSFEEGFGLQTPIVMGELEVVRYFPYYDKAFDITKKLASKQLTLTDHMRENVLASSTLSELHAAVGRDFWVVTSCKRNNHSSNIGDAPEGTRLTIVVGRPNMEASPTGFEFTIRMPCTPERWQQFNEVLSGIWGLLELELINQHSNRDVIKMNTLILSFFYYWVNFAPLTRGSSACGYAAIISLYSAFGYKVNKKNSKGIQYDWEAILADSCDNFVERMQDNFITVEEDQTANCPSTNEPFVSEVVSTYNDAIACLNLK